MHIAAGKAFMHWKAARPSRVLFVDGEMARRVMKGRLIDEVKRIGSKPEGFHLLSHEDVENFAPLNTPQGQTFIDHFIHKIGGVDMVFFDNIMALITGDQKDEEGWRQTMPFVLRLTRQNIGQFWLHHTGRDASRGYGTKVREWQMDNVWHLDKLERVDADV